MGYEPNLLRRIIRLAIKDGRASAIAKATGKSTATVYRYLSYAVEHDALNRSAECVYTPSSKFENFVDHIDTAYGGFSDSHGLSEGGLNRENQAQARGVRLAPNWTMTGWQRTYYIQHPIPLEFSSLFVKWGNAWRWQKKYPQGTAQFYLDKHGGGSVVLHLSEVWIPDGMEGRVADVCDSLLRAWIRQLIDEFDLRVWNKPVDHPDPKAKESKTPIPSGELRKAILGADAVPRERVGPAFQTDNSGGPALEGAGVEEARVVARAPFELASLRADIAQLKESFDGMGNSVRELVKILKGDAPQGVAPQGGGENPPGYA